MSGTGTSGTGMSGTGLNRARRPLALTALLALLASAPLTGCGVVSATGSVIGGTISAAGSVVGGVASATGSVVGAGIDAVSGGDDDDED